MPTTSKAQFRFMQAVASGSIKKPGLSKDKAKEFITATGDTKDLPEYAAMKRKKKKKEEE